MVKNEDIFSKSIARKFFDNVDHHNDREKGPGAKVANNPKAASAGHGRDKTNTVVATSSEKIASAGDGKQGSFDFNAIPKDKIPIPAEDEEDAWETEEDEAKPTKPKKQKRVRTETTQPWFSDFSDTEDDDIDGGYGHDPWGGYEGPELFMGKPRDREVAEIIGMNPYAMDWF